MENIEQRSDWDLVEQCKNGDERAWKELVKRHQRSIRLSIHEARRERARDTHWVEDMIQEVFVALIDKENLRLALYDPQRGSFDTFLKALVKQVIQRWRRREHTRREIQGSLADYEPIESSGDAGLVQAEFAEYLDDLTPQERRYLQENMLGIPSPASEPPITPGNERVLQHRLQKKWKDHFDKR